MKRKIIIDTDPGIDDAMALILAIQSDQFDIQAITTVCGNSTIENTTRNAQYIIKVLNQNIPVYSGSSKPLQQPLTKAVVHGESGLEGISLQNPAVLTENAVEKMISLIQKHPHEITLVTLGPLTNIAHAIKKAPEIMKLVQAIVLMGGAVNVPGNMTNVAEFNIYVDPEAADIVINFPVKKTLITLDACNKVQLHIKDFERIKNNTIKDQLLKMAKPYIENLGKDTGIQAAIMYDPLTVYYLLSPENCSGNEYDITIETQNNKKRGMTINTEGVEKNCFVVESISNKAFTSYFIKTLSKDN